MAMDAAMIEAGHVAGCHDISDGGLLVALAEMAMAGGHGAALDGSPAGLAPHAWLFGEDQARYLIETGDPDGLLAEARRAGVAARRIGTVQSQGAGAELTLTEAGAISVADLKAANEAWLPGYMAQT